MSRRKRMQQRMQQLQITQRQLAQYAMLSNNSLMLWFDNKITIPYTNLLRIADLLDLEAEDLLGVV